MTRSPVFTEDTTNHFNVFESYASKEKSRGRASGGILLLIRKEFVVELIESTDLWLFVLVSLDDLIFVLAVVYASPARNIDTVYEILNETLTYASEYKSNNIVLVRDLNARIGNLNSIDTGSCQETNLNDERQSLNNLYPQGAEKLLTSWKSMIWLR